MAKRLVMCEPGQLQGVGLAVTPASPINTWSDTNPAYRPKPGESIYDNMPTGATVVNASSYTSSRDLYTIFNIIDKTINPNGPVYIQFESGEYYIYKCQNYGSVSAPNWIGYANGNKKILGCIGAGFSSTGKLLTHFIADPFMINNSPDGCRDAILGSTTAVNRNATALYFSDNGAAAPLFFSAISFDGTLQEPFGVYTTAAQAAFRRNHGALSPIAWNGFSMWKAQPGSRFQYCLSQGFAFALNSAPPFECGFINTNYCNLINFAVEVDGRIADYIDTKRPRASGGWMYNKERNVKWQRGWVHHTRRSGMATNTNTFDPTEKYEFIDFQATDIANIGADDPWPSDASVLPGGFNSWNVEAVIGTFKITGGYANSEHSHINWAVPYSSSGTVYPTPDHTVFTVQNFRSDDSQYGGCLELGTPKQPNSTGISPVWTAINANQAGACALFFDIRSPTGTPLTPIKGSLWVRGTHTPNTHYVLASF